MEPIIEWFLRNGCLAFDRHLYLMMPLFRSGWPSLCNFGYATYRRKWSRIGAKLSLRVGTIFWFSSSFSLKSFLHVGMLSSAHRALFIGEQCRVWSLRNNRHSPMRIQVFSLPSPLSILVNHFLTHDSNRPKAQTSMVSDWWWLVAWCYLTLPCFYRPVCVAVGLYSPCERASPSLS